MYLFIFDDSENSYYISNGYNLDSALQDTYAYVGHGEVGPDEFHDMIVRLGKEQSITLFNVLSFAKIKSIYSGLEMVFTKGGRRMWKDEGEKIFLNEEEALSLLPDMDYIHTFLNPGFGLFGADWERNELVEKIKNSNKLELSGPVARSMGHGLCVYSADTKYHHDILFVETDEKRLAELEDSINVG